jgi:hypothetical protein
MKLTFCSASTHGLEYLRCVLEVQPLLLKKFEIKQATVNSSAQFLACFFINNEFSRIQNNVFCAALLLYTISSSNHQVYSGNFIS